MIKRNLTGLLLVTNFNVVTLSKTKNVWIKTVVHGKYRNIKKDISSNRELTFNVDETPIKPSTTTKLTNNFKVRVTRFLRSDNPKGFSS